MYTVILLTKYSLIFLNLWIWNQHCNTTIVYSCNITILVLITGIYSTDVFNFTDLNKRDRWIKIDLFVKWLSHFTLKSLINARVYTLSTCVNSYFFFLIDHNKWILCTIIVHTLFVIRYGTFVHEMKTYLIISSWFYPIINSPTIILMISS